MSREDIKEVAKGAAAFVAFIAAGAATYPATMLAGAVICAAQSAMGVC